ncbi:hypothetical protein L228DRAFT_247613 [Xylona heveae TC161]|uniref:RING-type domain-containing protein n=1 Tax=Xylona heveae (strain CBS 132557 / TC161) TaxID=1328760 RepID=A0A165GBX6_XYLHT|nr:hypothetical protein L228DRAFT_247613 [Xylona heveae TC161]KZF22002.1 hypothetical protein L228DRAFT_247613 [Xylona heveae TC161]
MQCIDSWLRRNPTCPLCRVRFAPPAQPPSVNREPRATVSTSQASEARSPVIRPPSQGDPASSLSARLGSLKGWCERHVKRSSNAARRPRNETSNNDGETSNSLPLAASA